MYLLKGEKPAIEAGSDAVIHKGGVGGFANPSTEIVSGGFADGAGRFRPAENIPYTEERPWALVHSDGVQISRKWLCHFCETQLIERAPCR